MVQAGLLHDIFFATSNNRWGYRDLEHPRQVLGYEPLDSADAFRSRPSLRPASEYFTRHSELHGVVE